MNKEVMELYKKEKITLSFPDKLNVVVQRIYQHYRNRYSQ